MCVIFVCLCVLCIVCVQCLTQLTASTSASEASTTIASTLAACTPQTSYEFVSLRMGLRECMLMCESHLLQQPPRHQQQTVRLITDAHRDTEAHNTLHSGTTAFTAQLTYCTVVTSFLSTIGAHAITHLHIHRPSPKCRHTHTHTHTYTDTGCT